MNTLVTSYTKPKTENTLASYWRQMAVPYSRQMVASASALFTTSGTCLNLVAQKFEKMPKFENIACMALYNANTLVLVTTTLKFLLYDIGKQTTTIVEPKPIEKAPSIPTGSAVFLRKDEIIIYAGLTWMRTTNCMSSFNLLNQTWSTVHQENPIGGRYEFGFAYDAEHDALWVHGGRGVRSGLCKFDFASHRWQVFQFYSGYVPMEMVGERMACHGHSRVFTVTQNKLEEYNVKRGKWSTLLDTLPYSSTNTCYKMVSDGAYYLYLNYGDEILRVYVGQSNDLGASLKRLQANNTYSDSVVMFWN